MVEIVIGKFRGMKVRAKGNAETVAKEIMAGLKVIYQNLTEQNAAAADEFRRLMIAGVLDPKSPVWQKEEADHGEEK